MQAKVVLSARLNDRAAGFPFVNVEIKRNAIVFPIIREDRERNTVRSFGPDEIVGFYARYTASGKRTVKPLGKDRVAAFVQYLQIEQDFSRIRAGLLPLNAPVEVPKTGIDTHNIVACAHDFKKRIVSQGLKKRSIETYTKSIDNFTKACKRLSLDDVTEQDIFDFIDWMRANVPKRRFGQQGNTYRNRLKDITVFFNHYGVKMPLAKKKWPKVTRKNPTKLSPDAIKKMIATADTDELDLFTFFLYSGFRDEEAVHAEYLDIDFQNGAINAHDKPEYGWTVKDHEERPQDIVLPDRFVERMKARMKRYSAKGPDLIFPNTKGKPNHHLLRIIQRLGKRAGVEERIGLHKIRRTFGTTVAKQFGIRQAMQWLGHSDISTTQAYMAADEMTTEQSRAAVNKMYGKTGD